MNKFVLLILFQGFILCPFISQIDLLNGQKVCVGLLWNYCGLSTFLKTNKFVKQMVHLCQDQASDI